MPISGIGAKDNMTHDEDPPERILKPYRCRDGRCGGLDCSRCQGYQAAMDWLEEQEERERKEEEE